MHTCTPPPPTHTDVELFDADLTALSEESLISAHRHDSTPEVPRASLPSSPSPHGQGHGNSILPSLSSPPSTSPLLGNMASPPSGVYTSLPRLSNPLSCSSYSLSCLSLCPSFLSHTPSSLSDNVNALGASEQRVRARRLLSPSRFLSRECPRYDDRASFHACTHTRTLIPTHTHSPVQTNTGLGAPLLTPETFAAMNMHTLSMGLALPALNPLQLLAAAGGAPNPFAVPSAGLDIGALAAAAFGGVYTLTGAISRCRFLCAVTPPPLLPLSCAQLSSKVQSGCVCSISSRPLVFRAHPCMGVSLTAHPYATRPHPNNPSLPPHTAGIMSPPAPTPPFFSALSPLSTPAAPSLLSAPSSLASTVGTPSPIPQAPVFGRNNSVASVSGAGAGTAAALASGLSSRAVSVPGSPEPVLSVKRAATESAASGVFRAFSPLFFWLPCLLSFS